MRIIVTDESIVATNNKKESVQVDYGATSIGKFGFQCVDYAIEKIYPLVQKGEEVFIEGNGIESKMIARKMEDKLRREVTLVRSL